MNQDAIEEAHSQLREAPGCIDAQLHQLVKAISTELVKAKTRYTNKKPMINTCVQMPRVQLHMLRLSTHGTSTTQHCSTLSGEVLFLICFMTGEKRFETV
jgi:hypothetical protein